MWGPFSHPFHPVHSAAAIFQLHAATFHHRWRIGIDPTSQPRRTWQTSGATRCLRIVAELRFRATPRDKAVGVAKIIGEKGLAKSRPWQWKIPEKNMSCPINCGVPWNKTIHWTLGCPILEQSLQLDEDFTLPENDGLGSYVGLILTWQQGLILSLSP